MASSDRASVVADAPDEVAVFVMRGAATFGVTAGAGVPQLSAGLELGEIVGTATCSLVLPVLRHGDRGPGVGALRVLLGLPRLGDFDAACEAGIKFVQAEAGFDRTGVCDRSSWVLLLGVGG